MHMIGYSTGAVAYSDFNNALQILRALPLKAIELSALRENELPVLIAALPNLDLRHFDYISFHAPSSIPAGAEEWLVDLLLPVLDRNWPIIVHPNVITEPELWLRFGSNLLIENMDKRKAIGRTADELHLCFDKLPKAQLCFDIGHARQVDPTMFVAVDILQQFREKIRQLHVSEVDTNSKHKQLTEASKMAFARVASLVPRTVPIIIESTEIPPHHREREARFAEDALFELSCV
jgi:hypothetical protein